MSLMHTFFKKAFLRKLAQAFPFPRGVNEIGLPMRDKSKRVFHPDDPAKMIQQRQKFDYGDVVEVLRNGAGLKAGSTGTVKGLRIRDDGDLDYLVVTDTEQKLIHGRDLAPTNKPKQMVERPKFPVGSRVETPKGSGYVRGWPEVGGFDYYEINADDSPVDYDMHVGKIRPYGQPQQQSKQNTQFNIGDFVKITDRSFNDFGVSGRIDGQTPNGYFSVYLSNGKTVAIPASGLELIGPQSNSVQQPKFKVGDQVKIKNSKAYAGIVGTLRGQNSWGQWDVDFPSINSTVGGWSDNDLELIP